MTRRSRARVSSLAALVLAGTAGAASGQQAGSSDVTITPASGGPVQFQGFAQSMGSTSHRQWSVQLIHPGGASSVLMFYNGDTRPPTGEYEMVDFVANDAQPPVGKFVATGSLAGDLPLLGFQSLEGTVVITASSATSIEGTFEYTARDSQNGSTVTVSGTFTSRNQEG